MGNARGLGVGGSVGLMHESGSGVGVEAVMAGQSVGGGAFKGELRECGGGINCGVGEVIGFSVGSNGVFVITNEGVIEAVEGITVAHYACRVVYEGEMVT